MGAAFLRGRALRGLYAPAGPRRNAPAAKAAFPASSHLPGADSPAGWRSKSHQNAGKA